MASGFRRRGVSIWHAVALSAAAVAGCQGSSDGPPPTLGTDSAAIADPTIPAASDTGAVSAAGVPPGAIRAVLQVVVGFDDEGILTEPLETAPPGSYAAGDTIWADAAAVAVAVADSAAPPVSLAEGRLVVGGAASSIPGREHGSLIYAPAGEVALRYEGFLYFHPEPDAGVRQRSGTLWPRSKLCALWARGQREGAAIQGALAHGLLDGCPAGS